jgi:hypothetical protein
MIRCHRKHLEQRCRQRGRSLEDVRACIVSEDGDYITVDETHSAYPRAKMGLGDMIKSGLSAIGITPERVSKALGVKDCGCRQRAEALNRIGRKFGIG